MTEHSADIPAGRIDAQRVRTLTAHAPVAVVGALLIAGIAAFALREQIGAGVLWLWLAANAAVAGARLWQLRTLRHRLSLDAPGRGWERPFVVATFINGLLWTILAVGVVPAGDIVHEALTLLLIGGLTAGSTVTYASVRDASPAFILSGLVPVGAAMTLAGDEPHLTMGIITLLLGGAMLISQRRAHRAMLDNIRMGLENAEMLAQLQEANAAARELNRELEAEVEERGAIEGSLRAERGRMSEAQRIAHFGHWDWDARRDVISWSDEVYRIFGFRPGAIAVDRARYLDCIEPEDRPAVRDTLDAALAKAGRFSLEYRIRRPDGCVRTVHDEGEVVYVGDAPLRMAGVIHDVTERAEAERGIRQSQRELRRILDNLQDTYYRIDLGGRLQEVSRSASQLIGYEPEQLKGRMLEEFMDAPITLDEFRARLADGGGRIRNYEAQMCHRDGKVVHVSTNAQYLRDGAGTVLGIEGTVRDITELKQAQQALSQERERALVTLESIGDGVVTTDHQGYIDYINPVAERLLNFPEERVRGRHYLEVLHLTDETTGESLEDLVNLCLSERDALVHADNGLLKHDDGTEYTIKVTAAPMRGDNGKVVGAVLVMHDITEVLGMARQLSYQAYHDMLTGLANRHEFERRLEALLHSANQGHRHALFYMDLDQFKLVNDTCGHQAGDELLKQLSVLLLERIREHDVLARLGGDEFGVLLEDCGSEQARRVAEQLRRVIEEFRFVWEEKSFGIGVSIGIVPLEGEGDTVAEVLSKADAACYYAKESGRNRAVLYQADDGPLQRHHGEMEWVHRITDAFEDDRFVLYAHPIVPLEGAEEERPRVEVLMRMLDKADGRIVPPMAFIPAAERYNLMPTLDRWVVRTTFGKLRELQGPHEAPPLACSINLSGQSLTDTHFLDFVIRQFEETGIPYECICFEITETAAITNLTRAMRFISVLSGVGVEFALDDFGSGLSSFNYLKNLPVHYLKIDGSFVQDIVNDPIDREMVAAINRVGHVMGILTIAEFVENDAIAAVLRELDVDYAQGDGIASPGHWEKVVAPLQRRHAKPAVPTSL